MTKQRDLADHERALWDEVTRDVRRPQRKRKARVSGSTAPEKKASVVPSAKKHVPAPPVAAALGLRKAARNVPGLDGATSERLRRGKVEPDASLDLHGMTQAQAHTRLVSFVARAHERGYRCVLIVTGKGSPMRAEAETSARGFVMPERSKAGVLRELAPMWLESAETRRMVVGVQQAHVRHGGAGALYVYLKRKAPRA